MTAIAFFVGLVVGLSIGLCIAAIAEARAQERSFAAGRLRGNRDAMGVVRERMDESSEWRGA